MIGLKKSLLTLLVATSFISPTVLAEESAIITAGDKSLSEDQFTKNIEDTYGESYLQSWVLRQALEQAVEDPKSLHSEAEAFLEELNQQFESEDEKTAYFRELGLLSEEQYVDSLYENLLLDEVLVAHVDTADETIQQWAESDYQPAVELAHILVETPEDAQEVLNDLNNGQEFKDVAAAKSVDSLTKDHGGYLGRLTKDQLPEEFVTAIEGTENNQLVDQALVTDQGVHILYVINNGTPLTWENDKDALKELYLVEKTNDPAFQEDTLTKIVKEADIQIHSDKYKDLLKGLGYE